jgi:uncharacterized membrane protein
MPERDYLPEEYAWTCFAIAFVGLWMLFAPFTFGILSPKMLYNNLAVGFILLILAPFGFTRYYAWTLNLSAIVGIWLQLAPVVFWATEAAGFLNDTLCGLLVIFFAGLLPRSKKDLLDVGMEIPPGWSYNPSGWVQRVPVITLGVLAWFLARYMGTFQLGYIHSLWDPVFGQGTFDVINSDISKKFPVSDASLGAFAYTLDVVMGCQGGPNRWYRMPWSVIFFGFLIIPLGAISILLIIIQPILVGHWCFWCLLTALIMLLMISFTVSEVVAVLQYLFWAKRKKFPFWKTFWHGGEMKEGSRDLRSPKFCGTFAKTFPAMLWGITFPWNLVLSSFIGLWVMFSPSYLGIGGMFADNAYIIGAISTVIAVIALGEVARTLRYINVIIGAWMIVSTFTLPGTNWYGIINMAIAGVLFILLSLRRGKIKEKYGSWDRYII